jgi:hypothetical protein
MSVALEQGTVISFIAKKRGGNNCNRFRNRDEKNMSVTLEQGKVI